MSKCKHINIATHTCNFIIVSSIYRQNVNYKGTGSLSESSEARAYIKGFN